jgi:restriction system protein
LSEVNATGVSLHGADGDVDILLRRQGVVKAVQCKKWTTNVVGVKDVRELQGALGDHGAQTGVFVTAGRFTADAIAFAERRGMELVDGAALLTLIAGVQTPSGVPIAPVPVQPGTPEPTCPRCNAELVVKVNRTTGKQFLSCSRYPPCRGSRSL